MLQIFQSHSNDRHGFVKVAAASPIVTVANCQRNAEQIIELMRRTSDDGVAITVFPELCLTGYTAADLFHHTFAVTESEIALDNILSMTGTVPVVGIIGMPIFSNGKLYNCAAVIAEGEIMGVIPKTYLPNCGEAYEARWFSSGYASKNTTVSLCGKEVPFGTDIVFQCSKSRIAFGVEIDDDLSAPIPPSVNLTLQGAQIIFNLAASSETIGKEQFRKALLSVHSKKCICGYVFASSGKGESTTDLVYGGATYIAETGKILAGGERYMQESHYCATDIDVMGIDALRMRSKTVVNIMDNKTVRFVEVALRNDLEEISLTRKIDPHPFVPSSDVELRESCEEVFNIQTNGLAQRLSASRTNKAIIGVSGGLDSSLALLVAVRAMDLMCRPHTDVIGITMPGFGTTSRTYNNAMGLMKTLGIEVEEIDITASCRQHFADIGIAEEDRSVTYENAQARERTQILMDYANKVNGLVVGTGDLSELALGWTTYNGDQMSMYGVNAGIPKTIIRHIIEYVSKTYLSEEAGKYLADIIDTPISPELLPSDEEGKIGQKTENLVGPYELHDFFIYYFLKYGFSPTRLFQMADNAFDGKYSKETIKKWLITFLRRFFTQQFKRSAMPDGPIVGSISLSPRGEWKMPSDATPAMWLNVAEEL